LEPLGIIIKNTSGAPEVSKNYPQGFIKNVKQTKAPGVILNNPQGPRGIFSKQMLIAVGLGSDVNE
jgi:hypothetical protein